jgi:hypothetical protein
VNPAAILALISDLYAQIGQLRQENEMLRDAAERQQEQSSPSA